MLGNFNYCNPTKLYFGEDSPDYLNEELPKYGKNIMLTYGGGSIKKRYLREYEGCRLAQENSAVQNPADYEVRSNIIWAAL